MAGERIGVVGLGYVGLPVALAFARHFPGTVGFDVNREKVDDLRRGIDRTGEVSLEDLKGTSLQITSNPEDLRGSTFIIVAVPTPVDGAHRPDLSAVLKASEIVGRVLQKGALVCFESTVYPGVTEDVCGPVLERASGLKRGVDFKLGYSPERINPGDAQHRFETIIKVVAGEDPEALERVAATYGAVVAAGVHRAPTIKVAEAAKVIENTQRDLNIALMNELAIIFERLGIRTQDVLDAAATKWNFLRFSPGLVGGHCIGVDPYYLTYKAEAVGYHPQVILAGRRINDGMGGYVAQRAVKMLGQSGRSLKGLRVAVLGLTFKEDVPDLRNSRVPDIIAELRQYGIEPMIHDPVAEPREVQAEYDLTITPWDELHNLDGIILAVGHRMYRNMPPDRLLSLVRADGVVVDVKSILSPEHVPDGLLYWSL